MTYYYRVRGVNGDGPGPWALAAATTTTTLAPREAQAANTPATGAPSISGTAQVGETLTADTSDISGATDSTYTLVDDDAGKAVSVAVSFTDDTGSAESVTSAATAAVAAPPLTASFEKSIRIAIRAEAKQSETVVWEATLALAVADTPWATVGNTNEGYGSSASPLLSATHGTLSPDSFTVGSTTHTVEILAYQTGSTPQLLVFTDTGVTKADLEGLELRITVAGVAKTLAVSSATDFSSGGTNYGIYWEDSSHGYRLYDWAGKTITVQLRTANNPAANTVYVSNMGQTTHSTSAAIFHGRVAQPFTTGSHPNGYESISISIAIAGAGTYTDLDGLWARLRAENSDGKPGDLVAYLRIPETISGGANAVFKTGAVLDPDTTYFFIAGSRSWADLPTVKRTVSTSVDSGESAGWSLGKYQAYDTNSESWGDTTLTLKMEVSGFQSDVSGSAPDAPASVSVGDATASGKCRLAVSWTPPSNDGGSAVLGYHVKLVGQGVWRPVPAEPQGAQPSVPSTAGRRTKFK